MNLNSGSIQIHYEAAPTWIYDSSKHLVHLHLQLFLTSTWTPRAGLNLLLLPTVSRGDAEVAASPGGQGGPSLDSRPSSSRWWKKQRKKIKLVSSETSGMVVNFSSTPPKFGRVSLEEFQFGEFGRQSHHFGGSDPWWS